MTWFSYFIFYPASLFFTTERLPGTWSGPRSIFFYSWWWSLGSFRFLTYIKDINKAAEKPSVLFFQLFLFFFVVVLIPLGLGSMMPYVEITSSIVNEMDWVSYVSLEALMILITQQSRSISRFDVLSEHHHPIRLAEFIMFCHFYPDIYIIHFKFADYFISISNSLTKSIKLKFQSSMLY